MADRSDKVRVEGLRDVQKALRQIDAGLTKELRLRQKAIADDIVDKAQARARSQGGVARKSADAISGKGEQRYAKVVFDATRFPYALGAEFGAKQYKQFEAWRGNQYTDPLGQDVGYFLHPTLRAEREHIIDLYDDMIDDLLRKASD